MIGIEETESGLYITDAAKHELHIELVDWQAGGEEKPIERRVDKTVAGTASAMRFPQSAVCIETEGRNQWRTYGNETTDLTIEDGEHLIQISSNLYVYIRIDGGFVISRNADSSRIKIDFGAVTPITVGVRSMIRRPEHTIKTPPTPDKLAEAVTNLSIALETTSPDRSYPTLRGFPPRLKLDDELTIPDSVRENRERTGITLSVPKKLGAIFAAAPLAYYLQAELSAEEGRSPTLEIQPVGRTLGLTEGAEFENDIVSLLRRVFWLDCLVRNVGPYGVELVEEGLLDRLEFDAQQLYSASPAERLATYLDSDFESINAELPEWHLATYVKPVAKHVSAIPHLLDKLSLIYEPRSKPAETSDLLDYSLDRFHRSVRNSVPSDSVRKAEPRVPASQHGRVAGWMADGYPVGVYKVFPEALANKFDYLDSPQQPKRIVVIVNDPEMEEEKSLVAGKYQERSEELSIDVSVYQDISTDKLAAIFERETDFVHYIGHCTEAGLRCNDGKLSISSIDGSRAKTFFLNACGSFNEGVQLIKQGSVSGVVTRDRVLNDEATRIGSTFGNLVVHGIDIEQSLRFARKRSIANLEYFVIGDGTYKLTQGDFLNPGYVRIESGEQEDRYFVSDHDDNARGIGTCSQTYLSNKNSYRLAGNSWDLKVNREELANYLNNRKAPVIYDGTYYWSNDLSIKLRN